jgi:hypothetical protein
MSDILGNIACKRGFLALSAGLGEDVDIDWQLQKSPIYGGLPMRSSWIRAAIFIEFATFTL